jgi:hypothetical protein
MIQLQSAPLLILVLSGNPADLAQASASGIPAPASRSDDPDWRPILTRLHLEGARPVEATGWR